MDHVPEFLSLEKIKCSHCPENLTGMTIPALSLPNRDELSAPGVISGIKAGLFLRSQANALHCKFSFIHREAVYNSS